MSALAAGSSAAASSGTKRPFPSDTAERRVQPRHFHFGPNPVTTSASSAAAGAQADDLPPAARLYRHALESIFGWLNQRELAVALQVSKSWLVAVQSMASLQLAIRKTAAPLRVIAETAMGRHVVQLGEDDSDVSITADSLFIIARLMPQLRELNCKTKLKPKNGPLIFPPALQTLALEITGFHAAADVSAALKAVSRLLVLEALFLNVRSFGDQLSFAPLLSLPQLRHLDIHASDEDAELTDSQVAKLRDLPRLHQLDVWPMPTSLLRRLLALPHDLQWQQIRLSDPLDDEATALLPQLPSLTKVDVWCSGSTFDWLQQLPNLTHVDMLVQELGEVGGASMDSLVAALQCCSAIEYLTLLRSDLRAAHLADLLPRLPRLRTLELFHLGIDSLSFLAQPPMTQQLSSLALSSCARLPVADLRHVLSLKGLESLRIFRSFTTPLDDHSRWLLTPPSITLPQLEKFTYTAP